MGQSVPKTFAPPRAFGSVAAPTVNEAQATPFIQGPNFLPLNQQEATQPAPQAQPVNIDPYQDPNFQEQVRQKYRDVGSPIMPFFGY